MKLILGCYDKEVHPYHLKYLGDISEWTLSDIDPKFEGIIRVDARDIPLRDLDAIYASHVLEHIKYDEVLSTLTHWRECLKPGGTVTINVPDITWGLNMLMRINSGEMTDSLYFHNRERLMEVFNGGMQTEHDVHKSWYNKARLGDFLKTVGFKDIKVHTEYEAHDMMCVIAEATK